MVRLGAAPVKLEDDVLTFVVYDDITDQVRAREALRAARDAAEEATAAKSAFLANMSHEIRTPLNGILGMVELLRDGDLSPDQLRSLDLIAVSGESLLAIISDILDFSKIEAGQLEIEAVEFDLPPLIDSAARLFMSRAHERALELVCDVRPEVPPRVLGDPTRLRQVLHNLLGNAIKFTHEGEIVLRVSLLEMEDGIAGLRFAVRDSGIGIPLEQQAKVFAAFKQADASTSRRYGGTGLGLSISRRLVELMGGSLALKSAPGEGSEFSFELYLPTVTQPAAPVPTRVTLSGTRVLVVDDHPTNRFLMAEMLSWAECIVDEAPAADEALAMLRYAANHRNPYQLLLSDVHMPGADGFELAASVRADPAIAGTNIMMLTSGGRRGDHRRSAS
jgi:signal transduction histidine kinase